jgi:predicted nucleic acid-binding protein
MSTSGLPTRTAATCAPELATWAQSFDPPSRGTLAVVILAKQRGLIPSAADVLRSLLGSGFHLDQWVIREALSRAVGERQE